MAVTTTVLLRLDDLPAGAADSLRSRRLEDAVLVHTDVDFGASPAQLLAVLAEALGPALLEHDDPRGLFCIPSVVDVARDAYIDVLEEVGEGGQWIAMPRGGTHAAADGLGALSAVMSSVLQHMPEAMVEAASAVAQGDAQGMGAVADQVAQMMGSPVQAQGLEQLVARMGGELDLSSPAFQNILGAVQSQLDGNPELVARLRAQLFGEAASEEPEDG